MFWTPAFAGVTLGETFYETIMLPTINLHFSMKFSGPFQNAKWILKVKSERISAKNFPNRRWILDE